jgi:hypothetical protein
MKTKLINKKQRILRKVYGALSLSTALFIFQACYGTPRDFGLDVHIEGCVKSQSTDMPIQGVRVSLDQSPQYEITDKDGKFSFYISKASEYKVKFESIDPANEGVYLPKDTVLKVVDEATYLSVSLDAK